MRYFKFFSNKCYFHSSSSELTQVPGGQRRRRGGGRLRRVGVEDGAIGLVVDQVGHEDALLVLGKAGGVAARRAQTGLEVGVAARGVAADRPLVSAMGAGLEGQHEARGSAWAKDVCGYACKDA